MGRRFDDHLTFLREFRRSFETTGAVAPSGRSLARAMTHNLADGSSPRSILEVGPGTGAVTRAILGRLRPGDCLDLVEINPDFADHLVRRFRADAEYAAHAEQCHVHCCALQDFAGRPGGYDAVISGLPFNNFATELVVDLIDAAIGHVRPGGTLSFFEYMYVRPVRQRIGRRPDRTRLTRIEAALQRRLARHRFRTDWVFANLPPAWVQHLRIDAAADPAAASPTAAAVGGPPHAASTRPPASEPV